jgi:hypothetical protein
VTITGSKFTGATTVNFGSNIASFKVISDTSITAVSPPGSVMADVTVSTPNGTSAKSTAHVEFFYTYQLPNQKVTAITPNSGQAAGGTQVTITGTLFGIGQTVRFGSTAATAVTVNSTTSITATSPAGTGTVDVTVTSSEGTSTTSAGDQFTYTSPTTPTPTVTGISPSSGPTGGGTQVTITGTNFASGATVGFGGTAATGVTFNSPTAITATSPAGTGMVDVTVTTAGGTSATSSADQFTFTLAAPPPAPTGQIVMRFYIGKTDYYVNNQVQSMDIAPVIINSRTLLPIRYVATPLGAAVSWDQVAQKVTVALNGTTIELWIGQNTAKVNGVVTPIDPDNPDVTPVIMPPGRTMLPLRFIAGNLGCQVNWDQSQQEVTVINRVALNPQPRPGGLSDSPLDLIR